MKPSSKYILLGGLLALFFILDLISGSVYISFSDVLDALRGGGGVNETIVSDFRLPKAITAMSAGIALSVAGMLMQTFFRNPLAGPYVLGVNSLASLSVALFMLAGSGSASLFFKTGVPFAASAGAFSGLLILLFLSRKIRSSTHLLLVGMMIGFLAGALQSVLEYISNPNDLKNFVLWNMASVSNVTGGDLAIFSVLVLVVCSLCLFLIKPLNVLLLGDEQASLLGINVKRSKILILVIVAVLSGVTTAYCGPVGFVGLAMPHLVRILFRTTHHLHQLAGSILLGSCFMLFCDIIGNLPVFQFTLPVNVVTSLFGAPFVLWLILKQKNSFE
ncbi:MAG: FecCD family ABC transporter permease [Bacteroidia bacterium]